MSKETLPLLHPLGDFEYYGLQNTYKINILNINACQIPGTYISIGEGAKLPKQYSNGSTFLLKVMLQWLTN